MSSKKQTIELLAPAGSMEKMQYAFAYGADAVYMGIPDFSLRVRINKFTIESVKEAIDEAHRLKKKIYVTANVVAHNEHIAKLPEYLKKLEKWKPDALIISDPGVIRLAQKYAPSIDIHLSTQANATNWLTIKFWYEQGVKRVILGREVTLEEIKEIHTRVPKVELEYFVHGAMCMSYSGRCMLSAWLTGRSANLGDCAQPCRWKYKTNAAEHSVINTEVEEPLRPGMKIPVEEDKHGTYIFNSKDLCLIEYLQELMDAGICSFKIEGRAKSVAYLATVVKTYRTAIEEVQSLKSKVISQNEKTSNRQLKMKLKKLKKDILEKLMHRGYTTGFLFGRDTVEQDINNSHISGDDEQFCGEIIESQKHSAQGGCALGAKNTKTQKQSWLLSIKPHNKLIKGDKIRIMQPTGRDIHLIIEKMYKENGEELESAHGGTGKNIMIYSNKEIQKNSILFKEC